MTTEHPIRPELLAMIKSDGLSDIIEMVASYCSGEAQHAHEGGGKATDDLAYNYRLVTHQLHGVADQCKKHRLL
jgi:hypothetical protein